MSPLPTKRWHDGFILADAAASRDRAPSAQTVASEIDAVRVVNQAVEDGVSVGRIADQLFVDGDLAGQDRRAPAVAP
jgi:hypothetical protein